MKSSALSSFTSICPLIIRIIIGSVCLLSGVLFAFVDEGNPSEIRDLLSIQWRLQRSLIVAQNATVAVGFGGSGVIVSKDGLILTAAHVSGDLGDILVIRLQDGRQTQASSLGKVRFADAGMLKITEQGDWPNAGLADPQPSRTGNWCFALGHPGGFQPSRGLVIRIGRVISHRRNVMRTDCQLIGGDSGGPLFNLEGEVIGIHSRVSEEMDDNYHAPIEAFHTHWTEMFAKKIIPSQHGRGGGFLGVATVAHDKGVLVERIVPDSAAQEALLTVGDIITHVDDYYIELPEELALAVGSKKPGDEVEIRYQRKETEQTVRIQLKSRPSQ